MMLNKKRVLSATLAGVAGLLLASSASASGAYFGGQLGWGTTHQGGIANSDISTATKNLGLTSTGSASANSSRDNGLAGRVFAGYDLTENFAAELGYTKFSNSTANKTVAATGAATSLNLNQKLKTYAVDLVGKGTLPLQYGFNAFGKLGVAYLNQSGNITDTAGSATYKLNKGQSKFLPTFGAGIGYAINKNVSADLSWTRIQKVGNSSYLKSTDFVGFGLGYHFG